jgi:hypothetical protein
VNNHLASAYAKLGIAGRAELADLLRTDPNGGHPEGRHGSGRGVTFRRDDDGEAGAGQRIRGAGDR